MKTDKSGPMLRRQRALVQRVISDLHPNSSAQPRALRNVHMKLQCCDCGNSNEVNE